MKATAKRSGPAGFTHRIDVRHHHVIADEPDQLGGDDAGPSPQELLAGSLAACTAITLEMYARRKGWDLQGLEVQVEYPPAERGSPACFKLLLRLPAGYDQEQVQRLQAIAAKCPVHRLLEGEVRFEDQVELVDSAAR